MWRWPTEALRSSTMGFKSRFSKILPTAKTPIHQVNCEQNIENHMPMKPNLNMTILRCSLLLLAVVIAGCRDRGVALPTAPVTGTVIYNGKPLGFGKVIFFHPSGHPAGSNIAADGSFKMNAYTGENRVAIECYDVDRPGSTKARSRMGNDKSLIPSHYANPSTSGLTFEVKSDENKAEFVLKN